ncbi:MAG: hypothetical protein K2Y37_01370 [Pirellulales bacterium]|nr:hypothetical protein [Pirellulales bacterium]
MEVKRVGGVLLYRPRLQSEVLARTEAEKQLRDGYSSGVYKDPKKINEIIQSRFAHFYSLLHAEIPKSASRQLMEFLLGQYDAAAKVTQLHKSGRLSGDDTAYWANHGPLIRRALKHLAEVVAMLAPPEAPALERAAMPLNLDTIVICSEMLVQLYHLSDQTHGVHPDDTVLTIHPEGTLDYLELKVQHFERYSDFPSRIGRDTARQKEYLAGLPLRYDLNYQAAELDEGFRAAFGFGYKDGIQALMQVVDGAVVPDPDSFDVPFVRRALIIEQIRQATGWHADAIEQLLDGFSLPKLKMEQENRTIFKPKQEYRALRRAFFEMPHETGPHLVWSRTMARECLFELMKGTLFQRCPPEWKAGPIDTALAALQRKVGKWFEDQVDSNMAVLGFVGKPSLKDGIGLGVDRIQTPPAVGEIDYLGYLPEHQLLVLLEDKFVDGASEPSYFRDDISSFVTGSKPYAEQLRRKLTWVRANLPAVCTGLSSLLPGCPRVAPTHLAGALVTLHPTYASYFIPDYPCVSLTQLMDGFKDAQRWPFAVGVVPTA